MTTLNISMPESMRQYVEQQAAEGDFTASEYVRHLIRSDQERKTQEKRLKIAQYLALCEAQIANGECREWDRKAFLADAESAYKKRLAKRQKK